MPVHADFNLDLCRLGPEGLRTRLTDEAASLLAAKLKMPLQIGQHLVCAFEAGFETGVKPLDAALVETVLSCQINDLEPPTDPQRLRPAQPRRAVRCQAGRDPSASEWRTQFGADP